MNKKSTSLFFSSILAIVVSVGLSYVHAAWTNPSAGPIGGNLSAPVTAGSVSQIKPGGLSVDTFIATQNAQFDQTVFFRGSIRGGAPLASAPVLKVGGQSGTNSHVVITNVNGDVRAQATLGSDELVATQKSRLCADDQGHVVYCPQYIFIDQNVAIENTSLNTNIITVTANGTQVIFPGASYPIIPQTPVSYATISNPPPTMEIYVEWNTSAANTQRIRVIDTNGTQYCELVQNGDPTSYATFDPIDMTGPDPVWIIAEEGPTC